MMAIGSVTVNDDETHTGSGMALAIYEALKTAHAPDLPDPNAGQAPPPPFPDGTPDSVKQQATQATADANAKTKANVKAARLKLMRRDATDAVAIATGVIAHIQAHAEVSLSSVVATVGTGTSVGRTPNPNDPDTAIQGPAAPVALPVTGPAGVTMLGVQ